MRRKMGGVYELFVLALPIVISQSCDTLMVFTDRIFLSRIGPEHMNAATIGGITSFTMISFFFGLIGFSTSLIAQYFGAGKHGECPRVTVQALGISLVSYPFILLCIPFVFWLFSLSPISGSQLILQKQFLSILVYGSVISLFRHALSCFFSGTGRTRVVMVSALTSLVINMVVNYILIFGKFGFPALGIVGAAYGTVFASCCGLLVLLFYFFRSDNAEKFNLKNSFVFNSTIVKTLVKFGSPAGLEFIGNLIAFTLLVSVFHSYSAAAATASSIMFNWDMVTFIPLTGIEVGVTSLVARYIGARKYHVAERAAFAGVKLGFFYTLVVALVFVILPGILADVFSPFDNNTLFSEARPLAIRMLQLAALYVMGESVLIAFVGALRGAGDTLWTMAASLILHWTFVPLLYISLFVFDIGPMPAWALLVGFFTIFTFMFYFRFKTYKWKEIRII